MKLTNNKSVGKVSLGKIFATRGVLAQVPNAELLKAFARHEKADWGDVCDQDKELNDDALAKGFRLLSVYHTLGGVKFYIITEADRSMTTALLPED